MALVFINCSNLLVHENIIHNKPSECGPANPALVSLKTPNAFSLLFAPTDPKQSIFSYLLFFVISKSNMSSQFTIFKL